MKYLLLMVICVGSYYAYTSQASNQIPVNELSYPELLTRIKTEDVNTKVLLAAAYKSAADGCYDNEWLKMRSSDTQSCNERLEAFKDMCAERIFPDSDKIIKGYSSANKLLLRYSECTGI